MPDRTDTDFADLLTILHRGGAYGYWWINPGRHTVWWPAQHPAALPQGDVNVYFGVHPTTHHKDAGHRATIKDIAVVNCLYGDYDAKDYDGDKAAALAHVQGLPLPPPILIASGGGYQGYWPLEVPYILATDDDRRQADSIQKRWVTYTGGDESVKDLARVLRVPGSHNQKYDDKPLVFFEWVDVACCYRLDDLVAMLPPEPVREAYTPKTQRPPGQRTHLQRWADDVIARACNGAFNAIDGKASNVRVQMGKLAAGVLHTGIYTEDQLVDLLLPDALRRSSDDAKETERNLRNGIAYGKLAPLQPPAFPTDHSLVITDGAACCPSCGTPVQRSKYDYPGTTEHGWYCPRCKFPMVWPLEAWTPAQPSDTAGDTADEPEPPAAPATTPQELGLVKLLADAITAHAHFAVDAGGRLYRYAAGAYRPDGQRQVQRQVKALLERWGLTAKWSTHRAGEVVAYIAIDAPTIWERPPLDTINLANGLLDVATGQLAPHRPDFLSTVQLPVAFDPAATCPHWERFVETTFPVDTLESGLAWQILAWFMTPDTSIQKAFLLSGEGNNGKSTFLAALGAFLGRANYTSMSLQRLESDRFSSSRVVGMLANVCPDLPAKNLEETSIFKQLTGGDALTVERKNQMPFDVLPFCRLIFSANHPPRSDDATQAFFRRWLVVPFERTFGEQGTPLIPRAQLDAQLADPAELSGVLNQALAALPHIRHLGGFPETPSMRAAWDEFRQVTDPLAVWLDRHIVALPARSVAQKRLHQAYNLYCAARGRPPMTAHALTKAIRRAYPAVELAQRGREWHWLGIGLRADQVADDPHELHEFHDFSPDILVQNESTGDSGADSAPPPLYDSILKSYKEGKVVNVVQVVQEESPLLDAPPVVSPLFTSRPQPARHTNGVSFTDIQATEVRRLLAAGQLDDADEKAAVVRGTVGQALRAEIAAARAATDTAKG